MGQAKDRDAQTESGFRVERDCHHAGVVLLQNEALGTGRIRDGELGGVIASWFCTRRARVLLVGAGRPFAPRPKYSIAS